MFSEVLKSIIVEGQELLGSLEAVERSFQFEDKGRYVFVGVRQAGKSYLLYLRAMELIAKGHDIHEMLLINFDDERLIGFKANDFDEILKSYSSLYPSKPILFLDEIQNVEGWEHFARRMANQKYMVYITGSNAKMFSRDIATILGARYIERRVYPFSFREYLRSKGLELHDNWAYGSQRGEVQRLLKDYFKWGGFPELHLYIDKRRWLNELYEKIILGDILQRNHIKNEMAMRLMVKRLAENLRTPTSFNRLANMVKAVGVSTNVASAIEYAGYCRDAFLIFAIENYASKFVEKESVKKHYFIDNGLLSIFLTDSETSLLENLCAVTLRRTYADDDLYFYNREVEIDFYIPSQRLAIQASYSISDSATFERETRALERFHSLYGLDRAEIVTYSEEATIVRDNLTINVIPLDKWLIANERS